MGRRSGYGSSSLFGTAREDVVGVMDGRPVAQDWRGCYLTDWRFVGGLLADPNRYDEARGSRWEPVEERSEN